MNRISIYTNPQSVKVIKADTDILRTLDCRIPWRRRGRVSRAAGFVEEGFSAYWSFSYSQEEGTPAAIFENQVDDIKEERRARLMKVQKGYPNVYENQAWTDMQC